MALMETGVQRKADVIVIQEPPVDQRYRHDSYDFLWTTGRVMTARLKTSEWTCSPEDNLTRDSQGDVQLLALGRRGQKGRLVRIANVYSSKVFRGGPGRPAHLANWADILREDTILAGDFNAHSPRWNPHESQRRNHHFLEELIDDFGLIVHNDGTATRHKDNTGRHDYDDDSDDDEDDLPSERISIIDLTLSSPRMSRRTKDQG
jgi:hypothetical protein